MHKTIEDEGVNKETSQVSIFEQDQNRLKGNESAPLEPKKKDSQRASTPILDRKSE
jgi:hypothetical protein